MNQGLCSVIKCGLGNVPVRSGCCEISVVLLYCRYCQGGHEKCS